MCAQRKFATATTATKNEFRVFRTRFLFSIKTISNGLFKWFFPLSWFIANGTVIAAILFAQLIFLEDIHVRFHFKCLNIPHRRAHHEFMWLCAIHMYTYGMMLHSNANYFPKTKKMRTIQDDRIEKLFYILFTIIIGTWTAHWLHSNK